MLVKRSVNGRLLPQNQQGDPDYKNHHVLVNYTEQIQKSVYTTPHSVKETAHPFTMEEPEKQKAEVAKDLLSKERSLKTAGKTAAKSPEGAATNMAASANNQIIQTKQITQNAQVKRSFMVPVEADGTFFFKVPESNAISGDIDLKVLAPGGGVLHNEVVTYNGLKSAIDAGAVADSSSELTIAVDAFEPVVLSPATSQLPYKVTGKCIAFDNGGPLKNWTVFVNVLLDNAPAGTAPKVVAAVKTDSKGYFSFYMPAGALNQAFVTIAGLADQSYPLALNDAQLAISPQILVFGSVDDIDQDADQSDCSCHGTTPALPDAEDLVNSGDYSDDLGGTCVDFTTPNRSLEEFNYYAVVRTTEPEIKRVPFKKPPLLVVGDLELSQNSPVSANGLALDKKIEEKREVHLEEVGNVSAFFGHQSGWDQFTDLSTNGEIRWWLFEESTLTYVSKQSKTFPGIAAPDAWGLNAIQEMLEVIDGQNSNFIQYFCIDKAYKGHKVFYGRAAGDDNEAYAFWYFAVSKYFEHHGILPNSPDVLENFIETVLTKTGGIGPTPWWLFFIDYNAYQAPNGQTPLEFLKSELTLLFTQINDRAPQLEAEVLEFLKMAVAYFKEDYDRIPNTPEEIFGYINTNFTGDSKSRLVLTGHHAIDWDETPTQFHATTIAHGHVLNFKQVWKADGYSMGDLLYSLPLAPCQKKQIAIFDWDRNESGFRGEHTEASESMSAFLGRDRDVTDIVSSSLNENIQGGSKVKTKGSSFGVGFGSGAGAAGSGSYGPFSLGAAGGSSLGIGGQTSSGSGQSSAWQNSARDVSASSLNSLRDKVMQSASTVRSQRSTVVQAVNQNEAVTVQTDVVTNHNHCHSMTVQYFEVLRHFALEQQLAAVQECLFVPLDITPFTIHKILRWKDELYNALGGGELAEGIEALEVIKNKYMIEGTGPITIMADETIQEMSGMLEFQISIDRPLDIIDAVDPVKSTIDEVAWSFLSWLPGVKRLNQIKSSFEGKVQSQREKTYREEILPDILAGFLEQLRFGYEDQDGQQHLIPFDITVVPGDENAVQYMSNRSLSNRRTTLRKAIKNNPEGAPLRLFLRHLPSRRRGKMGLESIRRSDVSRFFIQNPMTMPARSQVLFNGGYVNYETANLKETLFSKRGYYDDIDSTDPAMFSTNLNERELHNPVLRNYELANSVITHLNDRLEYYHKAIWWQMDADKRFMLLDGFVAPNSGGRSVASVVENQIKAIIGNSLVFQVARGVHLDPTYSQNNDAPIDLFAHYAPTTPPAPFRVSVPTRGVYAEAVMGACNSCEVIDESRHWRFSEVPCGDSPTAIEPVSLDSRRSDPGDLQAKDLPGNIINFQNVPAAPAPQGFGGALTALSTPGIFDNITGLTENQKNALAALQANQEGAIDAMKMNVEAAQAYAEMAKELVTQEQMLKNGDKVLRNIDKQEKNEKISPEDAKEFRKDVIKNQIGSTKSEGSSDADGGEESQSVQGTEIQQMLPDNPGQFDNYEASSGDSSVKYSSSSGGNTGGGSSAPTMVLNQIPKDVSDTAAIIVDTSNIVNGLSATGANTATIMVRVTAGTIFDENLNPVGAANAMAFYNNVKKYFCDGNNGVFDFINAEDSTLTKPDDDTEDFLATVGFSRVLLEDTMEAVLAWLTSGTTNGNYVTSRLVLNNPANNNAMLANRDFFADFQVVITNPGLPAQTIVTAQTGNIGFTTRFLNDEATTQDDIIRNSVYRGVGGSKLSFNKHEYVDKMFTLYDSLLSIVCNNPATWPVLNTAAGWPAGSVLANCVLSPMRSVMLYNGNPNNVANYIASNQVRTTGGVNSWQSPVYINPNVAPTTETTRTMIADLPLTQYFCDATEFNFLTPPAGGGGGPLPGAPNLQQINVMANTPLPNPAGNPAYTVRLTTPYADLGVYRMHLIDIALVDNATGNNVVLNTGLMNVVSIVNFNLGAGTVNLLINENAVITCNFIHTIV